MDKPEIRKILLVAPNWIGDAVLAASAMSMLRERFPSATITIVGQSHICDLFKESPYVDQFYPADNLSISPFIKRGLRTILNLRSEKFDLAILFPNSFRSALLVRLAGIRRRCGYDRDGRGFLLNMPVSFDKQIMKVHQTEYYLNLVNSLESYLSNKVTAGQGMERSEKYPAYPILDRRGFLTPKSKLTWLCLSKDESRRALDTLSKNHITPDNLIIGINPGATYGSSKRWHPERFGHVARILFTKHNGKIIVFGSRQETDIAEEIVRTADVPLLNMAGKTSIRELMALIHQCRLLITNDSGPMHIAAALGVPVVSLFGSTDPLLTGPVGDGHIILKKEVACSPCFLRKCPKDLECLDAISVNDVSEGVEKILSHPPL